MKNKYLSEEQAQILLFALEVEESGKQETYNRFCSYQRIFKYLSSRFLVMLTFFKKRKYTISFILL